jgi:hypothetical protein
MKEACSLAVEAAIALGHKAPIADLREFIKALPPSRATPLLRADRARLEAEQAHQRGHSEAARRFEEDAITLLRSVGARPLLAQALLERCRRRADADALAEARAIYEQLGATRWLERLPEPQNVAV